MGSTYGPTEEAPRQQPERYQADSRAGFVVCIWDIAKIIKTGEPISGGACHQSAHQVVPFGRRRNDRGAQVRPGEQERTDDKTHPSMARHKELLSRREAHPIANPQDIQDGDRPHRHGESGERNGGAG